MMVKRSRLNKTGWKFFTPKASRLRKYVIEYPEFTRQSIERAAAEILMKGGKLDAVAMDYYLKPKKYGGLGMGKARF